MTAIQRLKASGMTTAEAEAVTVAVDELGVSKAHLDLKLSGTRTAMKRSFAELTTALEESIAEQMQQLS